MSRSVRLKYSRGRLFARLSLERVVNKYSRYIDVDTAGTSATNIMTVLQHSRVQESDIGNVMVLVEYLY
jgi:hypothetical protein